MNHNILKGKSPLLYITICFALICWLLLFIQLIAGFINSAATKTIPAFQPLAATKEQDNIMLSYPATSFSAPSQDKLLKANTIYHYLRKYDHDIQLISCHQEKNYTDLYFYSPILQKSSPVKNNRNFNLQVAITNSKVYFGTPFLQYDF